MEVHKYGNKRNVGVTPNVRNTQSKTKSARRSPRPDKTPSEKTRLLPKNKKNDSPKGKEPEKPSVGSETTDTARNGENARKQQAVNNRNQTNARGQYKGKQTDMNINIYLNEGEKKTDPEGEAPNPSQPTEDKDFVPVSQRHIAVEQVNEQDTAAMQATRRWAKWTLMWKTALYSVPSLFSKRAQDSIDDFRIDAQWQIRSATPSQKTVVYVPVTDSDEAHLNRVLMEPMLMDEIRTASSWRVSGNGTAFRPTPIYIKKKHFMDKLERESSSLSQEEREEKWKNNIFNDSYVIDDNYDAYETESETSTEQDPEPQTCDDLLSKHFRYTKIDASHLQRMPALNKYVNVSFDLSIEAGCATSSDWLGISSDVVGGVRVEPKYVNYSHLIHQELSIPKITSYPPNNEVFCQRLDQATNALNLTKDQMQIIRRDTAVMAMNPLQDTQLVCGLNQQHAKLRNTDLQAFLRNR